MTSRVIVDSPTSPVSRLSGRPCPACRASRPVANGPDAWCVSSRDPATGPSYRKTAPRDPSPCSRRNTLSHKNPRPLDGRGVSSRRTRGRSDPNWAFWCQERHHGPALVLPGSIHPGRRKHETVRKGMDDPCKGSKEGL